MNKEFIIPALFVIILIIAIITSVYFNSKSSIIRLLKKLPDGRINNLKKGEFSKITGKTVQIKEPLIAPYSNRKCVYYKIKIEEKIKTGKKSYWDTIVNDEKIQAFLIEKNGDLLLVEPNLNQKNYKSYFVTDEEISSGINNNPSEKLKDVLEIYDIISEKKSGYNKEFRCSEAIIEISEEITIAGISEWKNLDEPINGYSYSKIATLKSTDQQKLIITDLDKKNFIN